VSEQEPQLRSEVQSLIATVLKLDPVPQDELRRGDLPQWDSLKHVEIVFALEDRYDVRFDESEFALLLSTSSITDLLRPRLAS
jgi:acyl carrier protein